MRLRAAGGRFVAADAERRRALADLKAALAEADGRITDEEATELTGVSSAAVHLFKAAHG
ncbi:hypothetical protein [Marmoricola sp. RAF53]|uniref:hypothetical protein n=1 Tax=Marmoricola sp. RAF53 TaxID=3233059 RepID=UPI003F993BEE